MKIWYVGDKVQRSRVIAHAEKEACVYLVSDRNPIHGDLPGSGSTYLEQSFKFHASICIGAEVDLFVEVNDVRSDRESLVSQEDASACRAGFVSRVEATLLQRSNPSWNMSVTRWDRESSRLLERMRRQ